MSRFVDGPPTAKASTEFGGVVNHPSVLFVKSEFPVVVEVDSRELFIVHFRCRFCCFVADEGNNTALRSTVNNYFSRHPPHAQNRQCLQGFHARKFFSLFLF